MTNLLSILFLLSTTFLFSIGQREDTRIDFTINKNDSLTNIIGWTNKTGKWFSEKNNISRSKSPREKINIEEIVSYSIKEIPNIIVLVVGYTEGSYRYPNIHEGYDEFKKSEIFVINKNDFDQIRLVEKKLDQIMIPFYSWSFSRMDNTYKKISLMLNENKHNLNLKDGNFGVLRIDYYVHNNMIQYILSIKGLENEKFRIPQTQTDITITEDTIGWLKSDETIHDFMKKYYFESPQDEFKKIFLID